MKPARCTTRRVSAAVATILCLAIWPPMHVASQAVDRVTEATQALDADRVNDAIATLEKAVAADQNDPAALAWLGSAQVRKARDASMFAAAGWVNKGFQTMDQAVERFPSAFIVYMVRGITATRVPDFFGKIPLAVGDLSAVVAMKEKDPASVPDAAMPPPAIVRHDLHGGADRRIEAGDTRAFGEPVFVPHPGRREEDRGWLLAEGYDAGRDETFLELRDAGTLDFTARIWTGQHFPLGFHGNFYAA